MEVVPVLPGMKHQQWSSFIVFIKTWIAVRRADPQSRATIDFPRSKVEIQSLGPIALGESTDSQQIAADHVFMSITTCYDLYTTSKQHNRD